MRIRATIVIWFLLSTNNVQLSSHGQGFTSAMNSGAGVETRAEKREFLLAAMLWLKFLRFDGNGDLLQ
jgi:hypothetical protein